MRYVGILKKKMTDEDLHNRFFYANACHVCKSSGNESILKKCGTCKLISYCGRDHQKQHWRQHKSLCQAVAKILEQSDQPYVLGDKKNAAQEDWAKAKMNLMLMVIVNLGRKLLPYEEEMFKFVRACNVCHNTNSKELMDCQFCSSASFCFEHQLDNKRHAKDCAMLNLCFELDIASSVFFKGSPRNVVPYHTEEAYLPGSIKHFISLYINEDKSLPVPEEIQIAHISKYYTRPLTLLYAMEKLEYRPTSTMTVHVIGANLMELDGIEIWETLLHWLPQLTILNLMFVGPEFVKKNTNLDQRVCACCNEKGMELNIKTIGVLYEEYVSSKKFVKPDIVIGYNLGIHECVNLDSAEDKWSSSIRKLPDLNCPFILTSYTADEAKNEHKRLQSILNKPINYFLCERNPFSSLRPHRDFESESVYYQNQYLIIYKDF